MFYNKKNKTKQKTTNDDFIGEKYELVQLKIFLNYVLVFPALCVCDSARKVALMSLCLSPCPPPNMC